ncbi:MAG TPA: MFS transporter [Rariglobus sp.]|jgi:FSR family fosmidomycin resistance protein-like MFS transporter|nr:MFS transporter [Rariglobus sp.]
MKPTETVAALSADEPPSAEQTLFKVLLALSISHLINDTIQSLLPAIYPLLKESFQLSFAQVGLITFVFQVTASLLQPLVGAYTDRRPMPYSLAAGMGITLVGLVLLSHAGNFPSILTAAALVGAGSSIFHPEASRLARLASGGKHGFAQSLFQVGGNFGSSLGPLAAAWIVAPHGQARVLWFTLLAITGIIILSRVGGWYQRHLVSQRNTKASTRPVLHVSLTKGRIATAMTILATLIFSKYFYLACLTNYYTFYLIKRFDVSVAHAQVLLFVFLFAVAAGTIIGGPVGDRFGRRRVIWFSILGVAPFTLALPYAGLTGTVLLSVMIGLILASAFSAILVYAQELVPGKVGMISGIFFGFAFGMGGIGSALLGKLADHTGIVFVFELCGFLPLLGLLAAFLPDMENSRDKSAA